MPPSKRNALVAAMFLVPVLCCFVGIGAFIHISLSAEEVQRQKEEKLRQRKLQELADLQKELKALEEKNEALRKEISDVDKRIENLAEKLLELRGIGELSEKLNDEIDSLRKLLAKLMVELTALENQIAQKQKEIEKLKAETENVESLAKEKEELERQVDEVRREVDELRRSYKRLREKLEELRRWREEEEGKHEIHPAKPLPPGRPKPVFVECTATSAIIQPEGTQLNAYPQADDRSRFLAAARRTGYVVFLVRPNSFGSSRQNGIFERYRDLVISHNNSSRESIRFGFEPIDASWQLIYPGQGS